MNRRSITYGVLAVLGFVLWTVVVHSGISLGSRHSAWTKHTFGSWPSAIDAVDGSSNAELSINATFADGGSQSAAVPNLFGRADIGTDVDWSDSNNLTGPRFESPSRAGRVASMAVYVASPIDQAPFDQFQLAIYTDREGGPGRLVAVSAAGRLSGNAWNQVAIDVDLQPATAYWLMYNTNGRSALVNNPTARHVTASPLDAVIQSHRSAFWDNMVSKVTVLGNTVPMSIGIGIVGVVGWLLRRRRQVVAMLIGYGVMLAIGVAVRQWMFAPYRLYPSGHAMRTAYLALALAWIVGRRTVTLLAGAFCATVCVAAVYERGHYSEEIIGGLLLAWGVVMLVRGLVDREPPTAEPAADALTAAERTDESVNA